MEVNYNFYTQFAKTVNAGQSRSIILSGNVYDLYWDGLNYVPLVDFMLEKCKNSNKIQIVYELNGPIKLQDKDREILRDAWVVWKSGVKSIDELVVNNLSKDIKTQGKSKVDLYREQFDQYLLNSIGNSTQALELMRQMCFASRANNLAGLIFFVEGADMLLPCGNGDLAALNDAQIRRISIVQDWFSDPVFVNGRDTVCLIAESRSLVHSRIAKMPQVLEVEIASPNLQERKSYIEYFSQTANQKLWEGYGTLEIATAGLSIYALRQLLLGSLYAKVPLSNKDVIGKVEDYIQSQVGADVVEFSKPLHRIADVVGNRKLKKFCIEELIPRIKKGGAAAISGCAAAGPIGGGKTFIFEAVASELDMPVLVLKSIRSQWYGQTDVIFERLKRVLESLEKVCIFVDEADTQFGSVDANAHETEKRLTGKIQGMMSDPKLKGKIVWILMTARIHLLSPDIRRPSRAGDLIIPVLDPEGEDRIDFIKYTLKSILKEENAMFSSIVDKVNKILPSDYSAASFSSLGSHLIAHNKDGIAEEEIIHLINDLIPAAIGSAREYQKLQSLINCTRKSLLPDIEGGDINKVRLEWELRIKQLEAMGIK